MLGNAIFIWHYLATVEYVFVPTFLLTVTVPCAAYKANCVTTWWENHASLRWPPQSATISSKFAYLENKKIFWDVWECKAISVVWACQTHSKSSEDFQTFKKPLMKAKVILVLLSPYTRSIKNYPTSSLNLYYCNLEKMKYFSPFFKHFLLNPNCKLHMKTNH